MLCCRALFLPYGRPNWFEDRAFVTPLAADGKTVLHAVASLPGLISADLRNVIQHTDGWAVDRPNNITVQRFDVLSKMENALCVERRTPARRTPDRSVPMHTVLPQSRTVAVPHRCNFQ